jgi:hypothetical protein
MFTAYFDLPDVLSPQNRSYLSEYWTACLPHHLASGIDPDCIPASLQDSERSARTLDAELADIRSQSPRRAAAGKLNIAVSVLFP